MQLDIQHIIQKCREGDAAAQRSLYLQFRRNWYMLSLRYAKNNYEADDILQEGLVGIYRSLHQFDPQKGKFITWSSRVLVNAALSYLKKHSWNGQFNDLDEALTKTDNEPDIFNRLSAKEMTLLVQKLPLGYRLVFNMYAIEGYKHPEISKLLGISVGTSKSQLFKARRILKEQIEAQLIKG